MKLSFALVFLATCTAIAQPEFPGKELLGRVTANSVTLNMAADRDLEVYVEYGATSGSYTLKTEAKRYPGGTPFEVVLDRLQSNTRCYYRVQYREPDAAAFTARDEHVFRTQRPRGSSFTFALQFDPHMDENSDADVYKLTMTNTLADQPDFLIDLGDTTMSDKLNPVTEAGVLLRTLLLRSYYDLLCHSVPMFQALGNHEGEWGRNLNATGQNVAIWNTLARKKYFPNPTAGSFFSGDANSYPLVGQRQSYYAFEWGDALFVVLDPYWNLPVSPESSGDWSLTLGREQYDWLKRTLESSTAAFKFVFAHNLIGGRDMNGPMRGGIETAKYLEWGGCNLDDTWGFDKARPGWPMPIHQLLVANNVTAFFHGHDHLYARQELDGIVYQEGPQPSAKNFNLGTRGTEYAYTHGTVLGGAGYLRVQVSPATVRVEYVQTWIPANENAARKNGMIADSYTIPVRRANLRMLSAASFAGGTVAPDSIVAAFGAGFTTGGGGTSVNFKDSAGVERPAQVLGAAPTQINFVVPAGSAPGRAQVTAGAALGDVLVDAVAPGLFTANADGKGAPAALALRVKADNSTPSSEPVFRCGATVGSCAPSPIDLGPATDKVYLALFGTGLRNRSRLEDVTATIGGATADVLYAGPQPDYPGLDQINILLPRSLAGRGAVVVTVTVAGRAANSVSINVR
jgi:uncharacterized protein (TIGR03437 family)